MPPGSAGVPPASLLLAGTLSMRATLRAAARLPAAATAKPKEGEVAGKAGAALGFVRAGRPRSRDLSVRPPQKILLCLPSGYAEQ